MAKIFAALALVAGLSACGSDPTEQALYGAGAGMLGSYALDGDPVLGAVAGGAANVLYCQQNPGKCN